MAVFVSLLALRNQRRREHQLRLEEDETQRRTQAGYISAWYADGYRTINIENRSEQPIYDAGAFLLLPEPDPDFIGPHELPIKASGGVVRVIPPRQFVRISPRKGRDQLTPTPVLAFRDAQGICWQRDARGNLEELEADVFEHLGITPEHLGNGSRRGYVPAISESL